MDSWSFKTLLKGVFAKNERGYWVTSKNIRWWLQLILLLSVASIKRKMFKTTHTEEHSVYTIAESSNIWLGSEKNQSNFRQIIQKLQPVINDFFRRIRIKLIFHNISDFFLNWCFAFNLINYINLYWFFAIKRKINSKTK